MAILPIATVGHPELKIVAKEVTREELASAEVQQFNRISFLLHS